jgi:hypothetical protein
MRRSILCTDCGEAFKAKFAKRDKPGEFCQSISGSANRDYLCDHCAKDIPENTPCVAFTLYNVEDHKQTVFVWHREYIFETINT